MVAMNILITPGSRFIDLQCWATRHNLFVVEPLINKSQFTFTFEDSVSKELTPLGDVFALDHWQEIMKPNNLAPIAKREEFLQEISHFDKNLILIEITSSDVRRCNYHWPQFQDITEHLNLVGTVCVSADIDSIDSFDKVIFGKVSPADSVIVLSEWAGTGPGGIGNGTEDVRLKNIVLHCGAVSTVNETVNSSHRTI